jgi:hypothetical protein
MTLYVFLLWFFLILCLVQLWHFDWPSHSSLRSRRGAAHALVQRLRHRHVPQALAPSVVSPALSHWVWGLRLHLYVPGVR